MKARLTTLLASGLLSLLAACSGADPKTLISDAYADLGSGDAAAALSKFDSALGQLEESDPDYDRAHKGKLEALAYTDAARCVEEVTKIASTLADKDFAMLGGALADAGNMNEAIDLLDAGMKAHKGSDSLTKLKDKVVTKATAEGNDAALAKLKGLGYL